MFNFSWVVPIAAGVAGVLALLASSPKHKKLSYVCAVLMFFVAFYQGYLTYNDYTSRKELLNYLYRKIEKNTRSYMGLLSHMIVESSDNWLPNTEEDFFSSRTASLICKHLNIESKAPILPERTWILWLDQKTKEIKKGFSNVISEHGNELSAELLQKIQKVIDSFFLVYIPQRANLYHIDRQKGYQRSPVLLCSDGWLESLQDLRTLYNTIIPINNSKPYPMPTQHHNLANRLGKSRFSEDDYARWVSEHPHAPSGKP